VSGFGRWELGTRYWVLEAGGTSRDVKNEGRPDYVYENTGDADKLSRQKHAFFQEKMPIEG
jgi:hypothetical protein